MVGGSSGSKLFDFVISVLFSNFTCVPKRTRRRLFELLEVNFKLKETGVDFLWQF